MLSFDFGYSRLLLGSRTTKGIGGAVHFDAGPSVAAVWGDPRTPTHATIGAYAGLSADLQIWNFTVGAYTGYRGGLSLDSPRYEGTFQAGARVGIAFDVGEKTASVVSHKYDE